MLLMQSGCLCCTIRGDLVTTLEDVLRRMDNGRVAPFRRVLIETTGLADPAPVLHTIMHHPYLMLRYRLDGVITLVDAVNGNATLDVHGEAVKQAAVADRLVLAKTDLATDAAALDRLRARLRDLNPTAILMDSGAANAASLLDAGIYDLDSKSPDVKRWLNAEALEHGRHRHSHDPNRHDARIRAWCLTHAAPVAPAAFDMFLELLRNAHGPKLLRVKGIVALSDDPARPVVVHGVQHVFHPPTRLDAWPDADHSTRMVFILRDLDPAFVERLWSAFAGTVRPDGADAKAVQDSPLSLAPQGLLR